MQYVRFQYQGAPRYGVIEGNFVYAVEGSIFGRWQKSGSGRAIDKVTLSAPVRPSKIVCVGLNYADHARETGKELPEEPCLFMKPSTAVIGPDEEIVYPKMAGRVDYEAELALVISQKCRNVAAKDWGKYVLGYTCFNDVTARDLQQKDGQWTRAKGFDTFAPVGPWITDSVSPDDLAVTARVNGEVKQSSRTSNLLFPPSYLVPFVSRIMTLLPGDVIATGTPAGISGVSPGDVIEVEIEGIGTLRNTVVAEGA